jgi:DNA-binding MarR family transcriptional regulator
MTKKLLLQDEKNIQQVKEITIIDDSQKLKNILGALSWKILTLISTKEMYPLEIARQLGIHEQKVYYHIRKLAKAGAITVTRRKMKVLLRNTTKPSPPSALNSLRLQIDQEPIHSGRKRQLQSSSKNS